MYGAEIVSIEGNFDEALEIVKEIAENDEEIELVNSVNPYRIEGQKRVHLKLLNNWNKLQTYCNSSWKRRQYYCLLERF